MNLNHPLADVSFLRKLETQHNNVICLAEQNLNFLAVNIAYLQ